MTTTSNTTREAEMTDVYICSPCRAPRDRAGEWASERARSGVAGGPSRPRAVGGRAREEKRRGGRAGHLPSYSCGVRVTGRWLKVLGVVCALLFCRGRFALLLRRGCRACVVVALPLFPNFRFRTVVLYGSTERPQWCRRSCFGLERFLRSVCMET